MTLLVVGVVSVASLTALAWLVAAIAPAVVLRMHEATETAPDQAPLAHGVLGVLANAARVTRPRLYVIPSSDANGFAVASRRLRAIAVTEGVFERLDREQFLGLFALLMARVTRPAARAETAVAALALVLSPLVLPSIALAHWGLPGRRWFEVDRSAASLVGGDVVTAALEGLEAARPSRRGPFPSAAAALFCVNPAATATGGLASALATQPSTRDRVTRVGREPMVRSR